MSAIFNKKIVDKLMNAYEFDRMPYNTARTDDTSVWPYVTENKGVHCCCGTTTMPCKGYYKIIRLIASKGFKCPNCGKAYNHVEVTYEVMRAWRRYRRWPWKKLRIGLQIRKSLELDLMWAERFAPLAKRGRK